MEQLNPTCEEIKREFQSNEAVCGKVLTLFHLVSNKTRFRIICMLARGEFCVNEIVHVVSAGKLSNISQQLKMLTLAGLIEKRRDSKHILYSLKDERVREMIGFLRRRFLEEQFEPV